MFLLISLIYWSPTFLADRFTIPSIISDLNARPIAVSLVTFFPPAAAGFAAPGFGGKVPSLRLIGDCKGIWLARLGLFIWRLSNYLLSMFICDPRLNIFWAWFGALNCCWPIPPDVLIWSESFDERTPAPRFSYPVTSLLRLPGPLLPLPVSSILVCKNTSFWAIMGLMAPPLVLVCSYSKDMREMSGGIASMLRPCESNEWAFMSPDRSPFVPIILCSIFSAFLSQPLIVHNFSVRASKAGSKTTLILSYYLSRPSRDLNSRQFSIPSICASALVKIRSIVSALAS